MDWVSVIIILERFLIRRSEFEALFKNPEPNLVCHQPRAGYAATLDDGPIRYVAVITDRINSHPTDAVNPSFPLEGEWELVRDLRLQQYLPSEIQRWKDTCIRNSQNPVPTGINSETEINIEDYKAMQS